MLLFPFLLGADANSPRGMKPSVSEEACPLVVVEATTREGHKATAVIRTPPGNDRRPAIIFLHRGFQTLKLDILKKDVLFQPQQCRFLADGYVMVAVTFRSRAENPHARRPHRLSGSDRLREKNCRESIRGAWFCLAAAASHWSSPARPSFVRWPRANRQRFFSRAC